MNTSVFPSGEKRGRESLSPVVIRSARPPLMGTRQSRRLVRAVLDRAPPVDDRRAVRRHGEVSQKRLAKNVLRSEPPHRHRAIMA